MSPICLSAYWYEQMFLLSCVKCPNLCAISLHISGTMLPNFEIGYLLISASTFPWQFRVTSQTFFPQSPFTSTKYQPGLNTALIDTILLLLQAPLMYLYPSRSLQTSSTRIQQYSYPLFLKYFWSFWMTAKQQLPYEETLNVRNDIVFFCCFITQPTEQ